MNRDQLMLGGVEDDRASVSSVESVHGGGAIPPVQGAGAPGEGLYMSEEIRRTMHAWRGELPMQTVVTAADVQELASEAARALQSTAAQSAAGIASLTQETGATFGRVEQAYSEMDSRVESMGTTVGQLQEQQQRQLQSTSCFHGKFLYILHCHCILHR